MTRKEYLKKSVHLSIGAVFGCMLFLFLTNPEHLPAGMLLVMPVLLTLLAIGIVRGALVVFTNQAIERIKQLSAVVGVGVLVVALLSSLSQLGAQDLVLSAALIGGLVFYLRRFQPQP